MATARKSPAKKAAKTAATKDPKGGLTAAGRAAFAKKDGSRLKPGVKKTLAEMSPEEMKRKGSWAVRFYGRSGALPPLVDAHGEPTRFALTAAAWGEPVPKTETAARRIAAKGEKLLERYRKEKDKAKANGAASKKAAPRKTTAKTSAAVKRPARASR